MVQVINDSFVHVSVMCTPNDYVLWHKGDMVLYNDVLVPIEIAIRKLNQAGIQLPDDRWEREDELCNFGYYTYGGYENYMVERYEDFEEFVDEYTTEHGDHVVAFGYYGKIPDDLKGGI